jgi:hypothetical protein
MTMQRPFPTDKPIRGTLTRKGVIAVRVTSTVYLVDFGNADGPKDIAYYSSFDLLSIGSRVLCSRLNESAIWNIISVIFLVTD